VRLGVSALPQHIMACFLLLLLSSVFFTFLLWNLYIPNIPNLPNLDKR
jgi:hypothetical protein